MRCMIAHLRVTCLNYMRNLSDIQIKASMPALGRLESPLPTVLFKLPMSKPLQEDGVVRQSRSHACHGSYQLTTVALYIVCYLLSKKMLF